MNAQPKRRLWKSLAVLFSLAVVASACGSGGSGSNAKGTDDTGGSDGSGGTKVNADLVILAEQLNEVNEAEAIRRELLTNWNGDVEYVALETAPLLERVEAEAETGKGGSDLVLVLDGAFPAMLEKENLVDLSDLVEEAKEAGVPESLLELGQLGTDTQYYIPVAQANYMMAANTEAVQYLPEGSDIQSLSWDEIIAWGAAIEEATGEKKIGYGASQDGLLHRMIQGSLYPSYTGGMVTTFKSPEAETMWEDVRSLWDVTSPAATSYTHLQEQLTSGEVWVAFDHQARLIDAFKDQPEQFVSFPAPSGPEGRGSMGAVAGIGIPTGSENVEAAKEMIRLWLNPETQQTISEATGFFGVTPAVLDAELPAGAEKIAATANEIPLKEDSVTALLPVGLGDDSAEFSAIYRETFERIVLKGEDIPTTLNAQAEKLNALTESVPCWLPDPKQDSCTVN